MVLVLWSAKGGSGTSVCAVGAALAAAADLPGALLVDLAGDLAAVCGVAEPTHGVLDWLASAEEPSVAALHRIEVEVGAGVGLIGFGRSSLPSDSPELGGRLELLAAALTGEPRLVVVDVGSLGWRDGQTLGATAWQALVDAGARNILVSRACYLAVRSAARLEWRADALVVVREPGRALHEDDVAAVLNLPVAASLDVDPTVARCVDAGLLIRRPPRPLVRPLRRLGRHFHADRAGA